MVHLDTSQQNEHEVCTLTPLIPLHWYAGSPYCSLYIFYGTCKENFSDNQELLEFAIISFILITLMFEIRDEFYWSHCLG